jgi:hypothetical protein
LRDQALYLVKRGPVQSLLRWDVAPHKESVAAQADVDAAIILPSSDEQWLIRHSYHSLDIRPMSGGEWKTLVSTNRNIENTDMPRPAAFTPDGKWLLYADADAAGGPTLFRVPLAGGQPERLGDFPNSGGHGFIVFALTGVSSWQSLGTRTNTICGCLRISCPRPGSIEVRHEGD